MALKGWTVSQGAKPMSSSKRQRHLLVLSRAGALANALIKLWEACFRPQLGGGGKKDGPGTGVLETRGQLNDTLILHLKDGT